MVEQSPDGLRWKIDNAGTRPAGLLEVSKYPSFDYSMREVKRAGDVIAGPLDASDTNLEHCVEAFRIANNWRDAHAYPMRSIRASIRWHVKRTLGVEGLTAARLKRMQAIRRKLRRVGLNLNQLQDLGGCRAIVPSVAHVNALVRVLCEKTRHHLHKENDYIAEPKAKDGYRSRHLIFEFVGKYQRAVCNGRRVEVQVRTPLQHSWATAVEAVGLFRREDLKGNVGDAGWLRLFKLMSAEFAEIENCALPDGVPLRRERVAEIKHLDQELHAFKTLENLGNAVRWTEDAVQSRERPIYYLITYDNATSHVSVQPYFDVLHAVRDYDGAEYNDNKNGTDASNVVLVEAGKIEQLRQAYPNYFGDVADFRQNLKRICQGKSAKDFSLVPQERVAQKRELLIDSSWLKRRGAWS